MTFLTPLSATVSRLIGHSSVSTDTFAARSPGDGQVWKQEQVSESGSYVRARIKGIAAYVAQEGGVKNA